jgi:hypothetical protein
MIATRGMTHVGDALKVILAAEHKTGDHIGRPILYCDQCRAILEGTPPK